MNSLKTFKHFSVQDSVIGCGSVLAKNINPQN